MAAGFSQKYVATTLCVAGPSVSNWESGKTKPTPENLSALADLYNVTVDYLLGREEASFDLSSQVRAFDGGEIDFTELQKIKAMLEDALKNQRQYAMPVDPRLVDIHERLMALNDDQLKQADIMLRVIEQMGKK